ncbi:MAG TPA: serine/threonine-protein kinase, partial [Thermoguttaceae bacterium]
MSDSQSSAKNVKKPSQTDAAAEAADKQSASPSGVPYPVASEQPTVISSRPPILAPAVSDSVWRIMQGRIMPGDQIGHFELVEHVGGGGMGQVFRAIDTRLARTVALKILPPDQAVDAESLQRFQHEAQSAARLDHENIARVHYVGEDRGIHFIAFEFVEGENVRKLLERKGPLSLDEAIGYVLQLAEALAHADERHVVHRDIKPSNVLITPEGRVKLIDMGLARLRQIDPAKDDLTASGVTLGTFDYISPEQARDPRNTDIRSDIYSLGCTFYFMLTGRPPFAEGTVLQKLLQHHADPPPDVRQFRPDLPEETNRILQKMMAKDPRHRYLNPGELFADLILFVQQADLHPFSPGAGVWSPVSPAKASFFQRHLPWLSSIAALVLIVVMLDVFWSISSPREQAPPSLIFGPEEFVSELPDPQRFAPKTDLVATNTSPSVSNSNSFAENPPPVPIARSEQASQTSNTDNGSAAAEPGKNAPPAGTAAKHNGLLIVSDVAAGENEFTNLSAACAAARNDDVIELRYNGPREERPIRMANLRATIRPGAGYQPIILFRPNATDPVKYPRSMFSISSGRLTISNLSLEFVIPRDVPADNWSLMEIRSGQTIRLEKCSLTISNASDQLSAYHQDVAFFRVDAAPGADAMISGQNQAAPPLATIELNDTLARGEAIFLRVEDLQPVHLAWENGLLVTTEQLLW